MMKIFIITGSREGGKTLFLKDIFDFLQLFNADVSGFVSKAYPNDDGTRDFKIIDLSNESQMHLSSRSPRIDYLPAGKFYFNPDAIKKGEQIITEAIKKQSGILIIDDIGPIELSNKIWHKSLLKVLSEFNGILVFTVRERILTAVIEKYGIHEAFIENISNTNPRKTGESILSLLK